MCWHGRAPSLARRSMAAPWGRQEGDGWIGGAVTRSGVGGWKMCAGPAMFLVLYCGACSVSGGGVLCGQVAQLVEQRTENPRVGSSILPLATIEALLET